MGMLHPYIIFVPHFMFAYAPILNSTVILTKTIKKTIHNLTLPYRKANCYFSPVM